MTTTPASPRAGAHRWRFFRTGGLDQVRLETAADVLHLDELDQKLWVALSCPTRGLEFDERTLALIDTEGDGRIGVPEVLAAVKWAAARLNDAGDLLKGADALPLAVINAATPEGKTLLASAKQILASIGKKDTPALAVSEATDTAKIFAANPLNGDGIIPPEASEDPAIQGLIKEIIGCVGGTNRRSGAVGVTADQIDAFFAALAAYAAWTEQSALKDIAILGEGTDAACAALKAVRGKVGDFFARTRLAAFDQRAIAALNRSETDYLTIAAKDLTITADEVRDFPLARVEADRALPLFDGVNPAWAGALAALHAKVVAPLLGAAQTSLTADEWAALNARFAPYETWLGGKAGSAVEKLGIARVKEILGGKLRPALAALVAADKVLEPEFKAISDVERLARYHRDLRTLLHNFVSFADFYSRDPFATFQAGTLFLDSRSTDLCIRVAAANPLAAMSKAYIAYCACTRAGDGATMTIAACFTQGDSDYLFVGRNGVFYDRQGRLWYAVITSIAENPISIRQAFWSPYKKFLRMIEEQVAKRAAAADAEASGKLATAAEKTANADKAKPEPKKFDLALITGIGVALGSIGTFLAAVFAKFLDLPTWQLPLILVALMLLISLPSMVIAALKLRQRTLGPILESNGWAINGRVKINIPFGTMLTSVAKLPANAERSLTDPYADKSGRRVKVWLWILVIVAGLTVAVRYYLLHRIW